MGSKFQAILYFSECWELLQKLSLSKLPTQLKGAPYFNGDCKVAEFFGSWKFREIERKRASWWRPTTNLYNSRFFLGSDFILKLIKTYICEFCVIYVQMWLVKDLSLPLVSHSFFLKSTQQFQSSVSFIVRININNTRFLVVSFHICSMYVRFAYIYHKFEPFM